MQRPAVVDVNGQRRDLENLVLKPVDLTVCPEAQTAIFRRAVASDSRAREYDVAVRGPDLDGFDHLD